MAFPNLNGKGITLSTTYYNLKEIGAGNFGRVYIAEQRVEDLFVREVAIKIIKEEISIINVARILKDAVSLARVLDDSGDSTGKRFLGRIYDVGTFEDIIDEQARRYGYIVMEYIRGTSLEKHLRARKKAGASYTADTVMRYAEQLCLGLRVLHELDPPIVHQDIKPDNIMITTVDDEVRLVDFGLAAALNSVFHWKYGVAGTTAYMAPETLLGMSTEASDIYSIGLTLYELLTCEYPLTGIRDRDDLSPSENLHHNYETRSLLNIKKPSSKNLSVTPEVDEIVMRCLTFDHSNKPLGRYQSAGELLDAIRNIRQRDPLEVLYCEGMQAFSAGKYNDALSLFSQVEGRASENHPTGCRAIWGMGKSYFASRDTEHAIMYFERTLERHRLKGFFTKAEERIRLYDDLIIEDAINFWSGIVGIDLHNHVSINILNGKKKGKLK